ncbi:unnamed protein product, partial [Penicillium salamii]
DFDEKPAGTPESSKQATRFSKRTPPRGAKTFSIDSACSLTCDLAEILQEKPSLASSAVELLDLYLCLWECYMIKSAGKIRLEEERRFLQSSNEWLVKENEKLHQCCNNQELLLWDRRQAFVSVHQGVLATLQNSDRRFHQINYDLDLDLDSIWREFPNVPSPPPCLAANHHSLRLVRPNTAPKHARYGERSPFIECLFYPSYESECSFSWTGPDPLSPDTCTDDMFLYVSAFFILERVDWIELRLSKLSMATKEVVEEYPFFLPRVESMLGNLPRARGQIHDIILQSSHVESVGQPRFQLSMWPRTESSQNSAMRGTIPLSYLDSSMHISSLNPQLFVQNIVGNWGT